MAGIRYKGKIFSGVASVGDADEVSYDNTESSLTATNVQDAIDELSSEIKSVKIISSSSYCKMPDGTLMEWGVRSVTTNSGQGPLGYFGTALVQFSPAFASAPMVTVSASENAGYWNAAVHSVNASQANVMIAGDQQNVSRNVYWHAIGRWK